MVGDPVVRASGLRAVAVATVLGVVVGALRLAVVLEQTAAPDELDPIGLALVRTSIGLTLATIGLLWIWGAIRAARADAGAGAGLFALSATVAIAATALDGVVTFDPLLDPEVALGDDARTAVSGAARVCWIAAQIGLVAALARLAWHERRSAPMLGAAIALLAAGPMLVFDPTALAVDRSQTSMPSAWLMGTLPAALVAAGVLAAAWGLPVPSASLWRTFGRPLELMRVALVGVLVIAVAFLVAVGLTAVNPDWLRTALTGPFALLALAAAVGSFRAARRSIRLSRAGFMIGALAIVAAVAIEIVVAVVVPLGIGGVDAEQLALLQQVRPGVVVLALGSLVIGCAGVDGALRQSALATAVAVLLAATAVAAAIAQPWLHFLDPVVPKHLVAAMIVLLMCALVMASSLLGRAVAVAEARAWGERVKASERAAHEARLVHQRWREARMRTSAAH
jgi:hypothetical protein